MKSSKELETQMYALVMRWEKSGMSQKEFCKSVPINYYRFRYWCKRKKEGDKPNDKRGSHQLKPQNKFLPVEITSPQSNFSGVQLAYPNGVTLSFPEGAEIDHLQQLIKLY
jgi:hypothetical protein